MHRSLGEYPWPCDAKESEEIFHDVHELLKPTLPVLVWYVEECGIEYLNASARKPMQRSPEQVRCRRAFDVALMAAVALEGGHGPLLVLEGMPQS